MRVAIVVALALVASCTKKNPELCCTTDADCTSVGLPTGTGCSNGLSCIGHGCVAAECQTVADCPAGNTVCRAGVCGNCDEATPCPATLPVCDLGNLTCTGCSDENGCAEFAGLQACNTKSGACVECTDAAQCPAVRPFCTENVCHACSVHADCDSNVCLPNGSCGTDADTAYVSAGATDNSQCSKSNPCGTISAGLATLKANLKLNGDFVDSTVAMTQDLTIVADPGTSISPPTVGGAFGTIQACIVGPGAKTLNLDMSDVHVRGGQNHVAFFCGNLTLRRLLVTDSPGNGINASALNMFDTIVTNNAAGGVSTGGAVVIRNSIIAGNGNVANQNVQTGGLLLVQAPADVEFTTIANNVVPPSGQANKSGVTCMTPMAIGKNNILIGNVVSSQCSLDYSVFDLMPASGLHNKAGGTAFLNIQYNDPLPSNFYRQAGSSSGVDSGDPASAAIPDIDGILRPQGTGFDMGASEFKR